MKYINVEEFDINSPEKAPLKDFFILTGGFLVVIFIILWLCGFFIDGIIYSFSSDLSTRIENKMAKALNFQNDKNNFEDKKLQKEVNFLVDGEKQFENRKFKIFTVHSPEVNAFAMPGGKIFITDALLKEINTKKEIDFVIAHELGHFANKDHLRILGRQFVLIGFSIAFLGENSSATNFLVNSAGKMELKYSQEQELNADAFAVDLLYKKYGDTSSAIDFMKKISKKNKLDKFTYFFASHPHPENRIKAIENEIKKLLTISQS
jgi:predicted Zn-dependent protease